MIEHDARTAAGERWIALPQPSSFVPDGGLWVPSSVRVVAIDPALSREAVRLERELAALGIPAGDRQIVRLRRSAVAGEAFVLAVGDDVEIDAGTPAGAFRATRQLLHNLRALGGVPRGRVSSAPSVAERGFHLDAARTHFPAEWITAQLHALADVGVNVFQWHFSENEGFRLESAALPEIVSAERITRAEAARILETARDLHIAVIPRSTCRGTCGTLSLRTRSYVCPRHPLRLPTASRPITPSTSRARMPCASLSH